MFTHFFDMAAAHMRVSTFFPNSVSRSLPPWMYGKVDLPKVLDYSTRDNERNEGGMSLFLSGRAHWNALAETSFLPHIPIYLMKTGEESTTHFAHRTNQQNKERIKQTDTAHTHTHRQRNGTSYIRRNNAGGESDSEL